MMAANYSENVFEADCELTSPGRKEKKWVKGEMSGQELNHWPSIWKGGKKEGRESKKK